MFDFTKTNKQLKADIEALGLELSAVKAENTELLSKLESLEKANSELHAKLENLEAVNVALAKEKEQAIEQVEKVEEKAVVMVSDFEKKVSVAAVDIVAQAGHEKIESVSNDESEEDFDVVKAYGKIKDNKEKFAFYQKHKKELLAKSNIR